MAGDDQTSHTPTTPSSAGDGRRQRLIQDALTQMRRLTADAHQPGDNARILELMGDVPMRGSLAIATRRDPDFFALYRMQRGQHALWVKDPGASSPEPQPLQATAGFLTRPGFLDGVAQTVGYLGDLRVRGFFREQLAFPDVYAELFQRTVDETGCQAFLTGIVGDNAMALRALVHKKKKRSRQPHYSLLRRFDMANVHFLRKHRRSPPPGFTVIRGEALTDSDVVDMAGFLAADHQQRPFGWRFDDGELEHRFAHWPGFSREHTFVVRDAHGDVVACCTCWDAAEVKRYRVLHYGGQMVWVKRALSLAARLTGTAPLPNVGEDFRYFYLANLGVRDDDPRVFQVLVDAVYAAYADAGYHFFAFPLYEQVDARSGVRFPDPLAAGCRGYFVRKMPFHLYAVTAADVARDQWPTGRPGFEMALA